MANLLSVLMSSSSSLDAYTKVLEVMQNNVANASTPGYARQSLPLIARPLDLAIGASGGVTTGTQQSARDEYAEQAVRTQNTILGREQQAAGSLTGLQSLFDISGNTGIPNALNQFFQSASAWGQTPSDEAARQTFIARATDVAQNFRNAAAGVDNLAHDTESQIHSTVDQVNQIVGRLQAYNHQILQSDSRDSGVDTQMHTLMENLSQLVDFSAVQQPDATTTILMNGATPLLVGDRQFQLRVGLSVPAGGINPNPPANAYLLAADGTDITAKTTDGQLGALMDMRNRVLPSYMGDANQAGDLNSMAKQFADRVNGLLTTGNISDGPPPQPGVPLFTYDTTNDTNVAKTLSVDPTVAPSQLAAISPGPPYVSNGVPLALSQLATPLAAGDEINGMSYSEFYGNMAANIGSQLQNASNGEQVQQSLLAQARDQRQQISGVSLDQEAMTLVEFQRAYQANSRFITVLDQLTQDTINILR